MNQEPTAAEQKSPLVMIELPAWFTQLIHEREAQRAAERRLGYVQLVLPGITGVYSP